MTSRRLRRASDRDELPPQPDDIRDAEAQHAAPASNASLAPRAPRTSALLQLQNSAGNRAVQRLVAGSNASAQRHTDGPHDLPMDTEDEFYVDEEIKLPPPGTGKQIPIRFRTRLESAFNVDFSGVRVREGKTASHLDAIAYTRGMDIEFARGHYSPHTGSGRKLLAHELAHVVQQTAGRVPLPRNEHIPESAYRAGVPLNNDRDLEAEANRQARRAAWGMRARVVGQRSTVRRPFVPVVQSSPVGRLAAGVANPAE